MLFANGCSHTAGAEIEFENQNCCHEKAWPKHLADSLNMEWTNISLSGGSAERIIRTTIQWFEIDEHNHGSFGTYASKEVYEDFKATIVAYRKEQTGSRQIEMTMEAVGPIRVDVGN